MIKKTFLTKLHDIKRILQNTVNNKNKSFFYLCIELH